MAQMLFTTQEHYGRILNLIHRGPYRIEIVTYSVGRVRSDRESVFGIFGGELNFLGLALAAVQQGLESGRIQKCVVVTTEPPQEVEALKEFSKIEWRQHEANHAKLWLFRYAGYAPPGPKIVALVGSRNLTSTIFSEATVELDSLLEPTEIREIKEFSEALIQQSTSLDDQPDWFGQVDQIDL